MFFLASKCCFPALLRTIFPLPVTLNRLAEAYPPQFSHIKKKKTRLNLNTDEIHENKTDPDTITIDQTFKIFFQHIMCLPNFPRNQNPRKPNSQPKGLRKKWHYLVGFHLVAFSRDDGERTKPRRSRRSNCKQFLRKNRGEPRNAMRGTKPQRALLTERSKLNGDAGESSRTRA